MKISSSKNYVIFDFGASSGRTITGAYDGKKITWEELDKLSGILEKSVSFKCFIDVGDQRFSSPQNDMPKVIINFCKETGQTAPESRS